MLPERRQNARCRFREELGETRFTRCSRRCSSADLLKAQRPGVQWVETAIGLTNAKRDAVISSDWSPTAGWPRGCATTCYMCYDHATMSRTITQRELRNDSAAVLREVEAGATVIVTRNGTPVAELRPLRPHRFVPRRTIADAGARAPRIDADRFRADVDAVIDQRIDG